MQAEYHNHVQSVGIGNVYESVTIEEGTIHQGDVVVWEDPDAHFRDESVLTSLFIGFVEDIYEVDCSIERERTLLEFGTSFSVGRVSIDNNLRVLSGEEIYICRDKADAKFMDRFLSSDYERYMNIQWTRNGDVRVSGE